MTFWDFFSSHFWYGILIILLASNKNTFISAILLATILIIGDGVCPFPWLVAVIVISIIVYVVTFDTMWKSHYERKIKKLKHEIWMLKNH